MIDLSSQRTIGQQVKEQCEQHGIPVRELCDRAGVSQANISRWTYGESETILIVRRLHAALITLSAEKSREASGLSPENPKA